MYPIVGVNVLDSLTSFSAACEAFPSFVSYIQGKKKGSITLTKLYWCMFGKYLLLTKRVKSQDGWILAKFFVAFSLTEMKLRSKKFYSKKNESSIKPYWRNKFGQ